MMQSYDVWPGLRKALWAAGYAAGAVFVESLQGGLEEGFGDAAWLPVVVALLTFGGHYLRRRRQAHSG